MSGQTPLIVEVVEVVGADGRSPVGVFAREIADALADQSALLEQREKTVLEDALLTSLAQQIHERVLAARDLVAAMDADNRSKPMSSGTVKSGGDLNRSIGVAEPSDAERRAIIGVHRKNGVKRLLGRPAPTRWHHQARPVDAAPLPLPVLADTVTRDTKALNKGTPVTLVLRALAEKAELPPPGNAEEIRDLWDRCGVVVDDLASRVLVLNLPARGDGLGTWLTDRRSLRKEHIALKGVTRATPWDPDLARVVSEAGAAVYEESRLDALVQDPDAAVR
jgi:hypothetical protein